MELSELVVFNGKLFTFDDRTGIVFEVDKENVTPWVRKRKTRVSCSLEEIVTLVCYIHI